MAFNPRIQLRGPEPGDDDDVSYLQMDGIPIEYANGLRRALHADATTMCIDKVLFKENNTACTEEYIAHRLGLIPIHVQPDVFDKMELPYLCDNIEAHAKYTADDPSSYCPQCMAYCKLKKRNDTNETITVTDKDLEF